MINLDKISKNGHALFLAYDQGLEHGPTDFNDESVDPENILKIAESGLFTGFICQKGIAEKYCVSNSDVETRNCASLQQNVVPLILKLNGKTKLSNDEPMAEQICTVDEAVSLGASAVGYTIYLGSEFEEKMMKEFAEIERQAHAKQMPVVAWMYPRGSSVKSPDSVEMIAYAARVGLEIGADIVKVRLPLIENENTSVGVDLPVDPHVGEGLQPSQSPANGGTDKSKDMSLQESLQWIVKSAGRCRVVFAGGSKMSEEEFLETARVIKSSGAFGMAVGRNIWQSAKPLEIGEKLSEIFFS